MKHLKSIADLDINVIEDLLARAFRYQHLYKQGIRQEYLLGGKGVAMIFEKPSLRTKVAFEVATFYLGGYPVFLSSQQILASGGNQQGRESIPDIARNLERFTDLIVARVYGHSVIEEIAESVQIPVINALSDRHHPTQALADLMALRMFFKESDTKLKLAFIGDGNNVSTSLMQICVKAGVDFSIATPKGYEIPVEEVEIAKKWAAESGATIIETNDPELAVKNAQAVYADTFVSMGQEDEKLARAAAFKDFQVNSALMEKASHDAIFLHCLPAYRGEEVTDEVMDSKWSRVFDLAECRMHIAKALIARLLS